ncbi:MAG: hypothetical protein ACM3VS_16900, partial [Candidatus Dadabacteria bacterium]
SVFLNYDNALHVAGHLSIQTAAGVRYCRRCIDDNIFYCVLVSSNLRFLLALFKLKKFLS